MKLVEGRAEIDDVEAFLNRLKHIGDDCDCAVQAFDARLVTGREHLETAVEHANRAFDRGENVARDRAVEILLYAAGRRQINRALEMGVDAGEQPVVVAVDGDAETAAADGVRELVTAADTLGEDCVDRDAVREFFDVSDAERRATGCDLAELVRERVALLDVEK